MVNTGKFIPGRGDVVWIDLSPQAGHEQAGRRPAVILSPEKYNRKTGLALFCPITNQVKGYPFEVLIPEGLPVKGAILSDEVKSLDWRVRNIKYICSLPDEIISRVSEMLNTLLTY